MSQNKNSNISHEELLTFSNLTNLEWQFVNLEKEKVKINDIGLKILDLPKA